MQRTCSWKYFALILAICLFPAAPKAAVPVDDAGNAESADAASITSAEKPSGALELRRLRRVGVGIQSSGPVGAIGANLELNFTPDVSFMGSFGAGNTYQTFALQMRRVVGGTWFAPYVSGGVAHWYSVKGAVDANRAAPGFFYDRFLNESERASGNFSKTMIFPSAGLQYMQLSGEWTGVSVFVEASVLLNIDNFVIAPVGSLGAIYYF